MEAGSRTSALSSRAADGQASASAINAALPSALRQADSWCSTARTPAAVIFTMHDLHMVIAEEYDALPWYLTESTITVKMSY